MPKHSLSFIFILFYLVHEGYSRNVDFIPERAEVTIANPKYVERVVLRVSRSARRGRYVVNLAGYNMQTWGNNVTIYVQGYEYLHNEYRTSFVQATYKLCDFINNDVYGRLVQKYGMKCPMTPKFWSISNATMTLPSFPYIFPFTKGKAEITLMRNEPTEELMGKGSLYMTVKQK